MEVVAVTGGSGLAGRFIVKRLQQNERIKEIRVLDRVHASYLGSRVPGGASVKFFNLDLTNEAAVERALSGCTAVVHCAKPSIPLKYQEKEERKQMWTDSLTATEIVVDKMLSRGVSHLVHVGDAYSALPVEDNYGLGEDFFIDYPSTYMLEEYGEARTRAEMYARKAVENNTAFSGIFLRPVFVHGEGGSDFTREVCKMGKNGQLPYIEGERRGLHQFIYAGNLAAIAEKALIGVLDEPKTFSGELLYCVDETCCVPFREFLEGRVNSAQFSPDTAVSFTKSWAQHYYNHIRQKLGFSVSDESLSYPAFRLLFEKTVGFTNKKLRLLLDYVPEVSQEKSFELSSSVDCIKDRNDNFKSG